MLKSIELQPAYKEDLPLLLNLLQDAKEQMASSHITQWNSYYPNIGVLIKDIEDHSLYSTGARNIAAISIDRRGKDWYLHRLMVHSSVKGQGIAKKILSNIIQNGYSNNVDNIWITTNHSNLPMIHILTSLGFSFSHKIKIHGREEYGDFIIYNYNLTQKMLRL
ncbi:GNAT family N-acetyltransferase [Pediococcus pentosaceus]|uniref:GNAT family N-acetyltransferase n=1 Tax=Pediococcus TaxID=1253 RepID=UPI00142E7BAC|nr:MULTISPECIES: GNAT family N-acetyltransferase [unclassified Pediococcus]KAF5438691.1 GNAT family N-acetyltransferase [Pediococcus sp. EKM202D]KAF5438844.1 GNAT family N-acetyltransferase [Pediococcus sp. EKM201D]